MKLELFLINRRPICHRHDFRYDRRNQWSKRIQSSCWTINPSIFETPECCYCFRCSWNAWTTQYFMKGMSFPGHSDSSQLQIRCKYVQRGKKHSVAYRIQARIDRISNQTLVFLLKCLIVPITNSNQNLTNRTRNNLYSPINHNT